MSAIIPDRLLLDNAISSSKTAAAAGRLIGHRAPYVIKYAKFFGIDISHFPKKNNPPLGPYKSTGAVRKYRNANREKVRAQTRVQSLQWQKDHPEAGIKWKNNNLEKIKKIGRKSNLKKVGWTIEEFDLAYEEQKQSCWICGVELTKTQGFGNTAHADHNHRTGKRRGVLCAKCNLIEGHMDKCAIPPTEFLNKLLEYYKVFDEESKDVLSVARD